MKKKKYVHAPNLSSKEISIFTSYILSNTADPLKWYDLLVKAGQQ